MGVIEDYLDVQQMINLIKFVLIFWKIKVSKPVFNYQFIPYIEKILKSVCFRCSNILLDKSDPTIINHLQSKKGYKRFVEAVNLCSKVKKCCHNNGCFVIQPKYSRLSIHKTVNKD